jgi:hypothetical protein
MERSTELSSTQVEFRCAHSCRTSPAPGSIELLASNASPSRQVYPRRVLTDSTRRELQQLRFLLEEALARSQQQAAIDRRAAVLLLDGACEYAMALALGHQGLRIDERFTQKYSDLRAGLLAWQPDTWTSIRQLHEARNLAQHHGALADPSLMPTWAAQTQRFVTSLVSVAFEVELQSVLVAESVKADGIRRLLVGSERALIDEDATTAFEAAIAAFDIGREIWQGQRFEAIDRVSLQYTGLSGLVSGPEVDPLNRSLLRFEDLLEVQPFAPDIAEYLWLLARTKEFADEIAPTLDTARRAFSFVLAWVLRWEAFAAGYEGRKFPPPPPPYEPPATGADHPILYSADVEKLHHIGQSFDEPGLDNVRYSVRMTLADLPDGDRELWSTQVGDALNEIIAEHGLDMASSAAVSPTGIVRFHGVTAQATAAYLTSSLERALAVGEQRYQAKLAERDELNLRLPLLQQRLDDALAGLDTRGIARASIYEERDDGTRWLGVPLLIDTSADDMLPQVLQQAVLAVIAGCPDRQFFNTALWFQLDEDPTAAAALVAATAAEYEQRASTRAAGTAAVEQQRRELEAELRAASARGAELKSQS